MSTEFLRPADVEELWLAGAAEDALGVLKSEPHWGVWNATPNSNGKPSKVPTPNSDEPWWSYEKARYFYGLADYTGYGFQVLQAKRNAIDLDHCRNPKTGEIDPRALDLIEQCAGAYAEVSPSGTGLKVIGARCDRPLFLQVDFATMAVGTINNYSAITFRGTGNPDVDISHVIYAWFFAKAKAAPKPAEPLPGQVPDGTRNTTLFKEGCRLRRLGYEESEIAAALEAINRNRCHPPLDSREVATVATSCSKYEPAADTFPLTETGDAEFFAACFGDRVRYDHRRGRWLLYGGQYWLPQTDGEVHRLALDAIRARQVAATKFGDDERGPRLKWATAGEARKRQGNLLALAQNVKPIADAGDDWDAEPWLLGVQNGVLDLRTGTLRSGRPEDRITLASPLAYDGSASAARWERFVLDVCNDDQELADYLQASFGYVLTGETREQCFFIFYGLGSNGKSTFLEMLSRHVIPHHSWSMAFPSHTWSESLSEYQRAELVGRRLVVAKENEQAKRLNTEFLKSLTGDETISARHPYCRPFNFKPVAKFFLAVNHKPVIRDETHGMWRRVRLVPFLRTFPLNPAFAEALTSEAPGVLAWAVRGAVRYYAEGLHAPKSVLAATESYQQESNALTPFFTERCVLGLGTETKAQALYEAYRSWCSGRQLPDLDRLSQNEFGGRIAADSRFRVEERKGRKPNRGVFYTGIGLLGTGNEENEL